MKKQFFRFVLVGGSTFLLDMGLLIVLKEYGGVDALVATVISQIFIVVYNFVLHGTYTFKRKEFFSKTSIFRYVLLLALNYIMAIVLMYFFHTRLGYDYRLVRVGSIACMTLWNFLLYKYWVFAYNVVE